MTTPSIDSRSRGRSQLPQRARKTDALCGEALMAVIEEKMENQPKRRRSGCSGFSQQRTATRFACLTKPAASQIAPCIKEVRRMHQ